MKHGVLLITLLLIGLIGCSTTSEVNKTLEALDKTALAAAKAEKQLGAEGEKVLAGIADVATKGGTVLIGVAHVMSNLADTTSGFAGITSNVALITSNVASSTASLSSLIARVERDSPEVQGRLLATLANVASLTATTASIGQVVQGRLEDQKIYWLLYAIGAGVLLAILHSVFTARSTNKKIKALHADVAHVKSRFPA